MVDILDAITSMPLNVEGLRPLEPTSPPQAEWELTPEELTRIDQELKSTENNWVLTNYIIDLYIQDSDHPLIKQHHDNFLRGFTSLANEEEDEPDLDLSSTVGAYAKILGLDPSKYLDKSKKIITNYLNDDNGTEPGLSNNLRDFALFTGGNNEFTRNISRNMQGDLFNILLGADSRRSSIKFRQIELVSNLLLAGFTFAPGIIDKDKLIEKARETVRLYENTPNYFQILRSKRILKILMAEEITFVDGKPVFRMPATLPDQPTTQPLPERWRH